MEQQKNTFGIVSLVCGIVGLILCWFGYSAFISLACGIVAIIMSNKSKAAIGNNGMATAGLVLGIITLAIAAIAVIIVLACASVVGCAACSAAY